MPVLPNQIRIAELDYDQILTNLVAFMKTDPAFADYDFAGSGLRLLSRVLAYVIFYQNYYLTAAVNESFLDTAQLRSSIASHARMLGYNLKGTLGARLFANVAVELSDTSAVSVTLPQHTPFVLASNSAFTFYSVEDAELVRDANNVYVLDGVEIIEGRPLEYRFTVDKTDPTQRFIIPNANVDHSTVSVSVLASGSSNVVTRFNAASDYLVITDTDPVFFVQETHNGQTEIQFGNDVVGKDVAHENVIVVSYFVTNGAAGNNVRGPFQILTANIAGFVRGATYADANTVPSMGGADEESIDTARFLAPLTYQAQNRCVTVDDYRTILLQEYGESIGALNVFGGEQGDPNDPANRPVYGRVFIALKPKIGLRFTDTIRQSIESKTLKPRAVIGVIPQVIDPDYVYLCVNTSVRYDPAIATRTRTQLQQAIIDSITTFTQNTIEKFDTSFRYSRFTRVIDNADDAIVGSLTRVDLEKRVYPELGASNHFVLKFNTPIRKTSATTSAILESTSRRFDYINDAGVTQSNCFLYEEAGILHVAYRSTDGAIAIFKRNVGLVDVTTGLITIADFAPQAIEGGAIDIRVRVIPAVNDFTPRLNQLFTVDAADITIQVLNDATATTTEQNNFFSGGVLP